jgi:hypothetical protein
VCELLPKTRARPEGPKTLDCCCVALPDEPGISQLRGESLSVPISSSVRTLKS